MTISMPAESILSIRAGHLALQQIQQQGLQPSDIGMLPGAAGGPKALGITGLDQAVCRWLASAPRTRELIGASIGGWRMSCFMQDDPLRALTRLAECYTDTDFSLTDRAQVTRQTADMLQYMLGEDGFSRLLSHPDYRLSLLLTETRGLLKHEAWLPLMGGLAVAAALNTLGRSRLRHCFSRVVCHDPRSSLCFLPQDRIPTRTLPLSQYNLQAALMGSASIPGVTFASQMDEVPGAILRDGGLIDYHLDLPFAQHSALTLYPHFSERIVPGWFDKFLPWRQANPQRQARTILLAPSRAYLERLPLQKLPDRSDFKHFSGRQQQRRQYWRQATAESQRLGDAFLELVESGHIAGMVQPLLADQ